MGQVFINGPVDQFDDFLPPFSTDVNGINISVQQVTWIDKKNDLVAGWNGVTVDSAENIYYTPLEGTIVERPRGSNFDIYNESLEGYYKNPSEKYIGAIWKGEPNPSEERILEKLFYNWDRDRQRIWIFSRSPSFNDDSTGGFRIGDHWIDTLAAEEWVMFDDTPAAALWKSTIAGYSIEVDPLALKTANNLSDVLNPVAARNNLGLGSASSPTFAGLTIGSLNGYIKAIAGVISAASTIPASDVSGFFNANQISSGNVSNTEFDYLDGVTSNIQTQLNSIGGKYVRSTRFETIGVGTSGTVSLPTGATVVLDDFGGTVDAVVTQISGGRPINEHTRDASGNIITTTFDASGNWVFSSTPAVYPVAIVYRVRQTIVDYNGTDLNLVGEYDVENITGPATSINNGVAVWSGIDGGRLISTPVTIDNSGNILNANITGATNIVDANALKTTGASVNVAAAVPPVAGQLLVATSATTASWQTNIGGNAGTATALQNARTINGISFDGTTNITITAAAGTLTGTTLNATVVNSSLTSVGVLANLTVTNPIIGSITGSSGSTTGNANTATTLQTARTINGVSFDGSANITVTASAGTLTGTTLNATVVNSSLASVGTISSGVWNGSTIDIAHGGTGQTTANAAINALLPSQTGNNGKILTTDGTNTSWVAIVGGGTVTSVSVVTANGISGSVATATTTPAITLTLGAITPSSVAAIGTVTGSNLSGINTGDQTSVTGNAGTATALQTARTINGVSFDGTANITVTSAAGTLTGTTLNATVVNSSLTSVGTLLNLTVTNPIVGSITGSSASTSGNAATATALQTARTINGVSFDGTTNITVPAAAGTLTGTTLNATVVGSSLTSVGTIIAGVWNGTTIAAANGGTGQTTYAVGDLLYASTTSALSRLADVATGNVLLSGGVNVAPTWGQVADAHISAHTSSKITITTKGQLNAQIVYTDQANTYGAFDQIYPNSRLLIENPAATFNYTIASSAITAARTLTLPLTTQNEIFAVRPVVSQSLPADPIGTTSLAGVMMGLAGSITPTVTGRVIIMISGDVQNATNNRGSLLQIRTGTGAAPANGAALTGTTQGARIQMISNNANQRFPYSLHAIVTGLTPGTPVWIDMSLASVIGGTSTVRNITISAYEL